MYLRVTAEEFSVRDLRARKTLSTRPYVSVDSDNVVVSVGDPVSRQASETLWAIDANEPFLTDKVVASKVLGHLIFQHLNSRAARLTLLIQLEFDGLQNLSEELVQDLMQIGEWCGSQRTVLRVGPEISDAQALELTT